MRYPRFIAEMGLEANRPKLWMGVVSGYGVVALFTVFAVASQLTGVVAWSWSFYVLVAIKLATNTIALICLRARRAMLESGGVNIMTDALVMTGAIYVTGGLLSPLYPIYVIELTVIALLTNIGITAMMAAFMALLYGGMSVLVFTGVLPQHAPPLAAGIHDTTHLAVAVAFGLFLLIVPTFYAVFILRALQSKERELERRTHELLEAGRVKSQFMANITHELRTPIHGICAASELVESGVYGPLDARQREAHEAIRRAAESLLQLVDDLLLLAKAEAGKLEYKAADIDLGELTEALSSSVRWMVELKKLTLGVDLEPDLPTVRSDRGKLGHLVLNLLANAVKFTPEGGRIGLSCRRLDAGHVAIGVRDTGIGIPDDEIEQVFEEFRQVDGSDERAHGGIGLGLALVKRLAALLGADLTVVSRYGEGSTFTVTLPIAGLSAAAAEELSLRASSSASSPPPTRARRGSA
jgi:signal transduction histidine kinase